MSPKVAQRAKVVTNKTKGSVCPVGVAPVSFAALWEGYPAGSPYRDAKTGNVPAGYENQCAIKVSSALHAGGVEMKSFRGAGVAVGGKTAAVRAKELAAWLNQQPFCGLPSKPFVATGADWQAKIKGRTGIVFFANYWLRPGQVSAPSGDHIDLWNGSRLTAKGVLGAITSAARFGLGVSSVPGFYSDLGRSTEILFWEIK